MNNINRFKAFHGAEFFRISPHTIQVWRTIGCRSCGSAIALGTHSMSCDDDSLPLAAGLEHRSAGPPPEGYLLYAAGPYHCAICRQNWIRGIEKKDMNGVLLRG